jgi:hypothetical protein
MNRLGQNLLRLPLAAALVVMTLLLAVACTPPSPEERVAEARSRYDATLNAFHVRADPLAPAVDEEMMAAEGEGGEGEADEEMMEPEPMPVPVRQDVVLDLLIQTHTDDTLDNLTLDISQIDPAGNPKADYRAYVDVSHILKGPGQQVEYVLEDIDYQEGDGFAVEVRQVPPEEYGDYQEFVEAMAQGG